MTQTLETLRSSLRGILWRGTKDRAKSEARLDKMLETLGPTQDPNTLSLSQIDAVVASFYEAGLGPATINRYLSALSKLIREGSKRELCSPLGFTLPWQKEPPGRVRWIREDEIPPLLGTLRSFGHTGRAAAAFIEIALRTGMRRSEILNIKPGDYTDTEVTLYDTKSGEGRIVPIDVDTRRMLDRYVPWDIRTTGSKAFGGWALYRVWDRAKKVLGLDAETQLVPHSARHSAATFLVEENTSLRTIQEILGHKSIRTTERYAKVTDGAKRSAIGTLGRKIVV